MAASETHPPHLHHKSSASRCIPSTVFFAVDPVAFCGFWANEKLKPLELWPPLPQTHAFDSDRSPSTQRFDAGCWHVPVQYSGLYSNIHSYRISFSEEQSNGQKQSFCHTVKTYRWHACYILFIGNLQAFVNVCNQMWIRSHNSNPIGFICVCKSRKSTRPEFINAANRVLPESILANSTRS